MNSFFKRVICAFSGLLLTLPAPAATPAVGKDALRKLVRLPTITFQANWSFDPERGFVFGANAEDVARQISTLSATLQPDSNDAEKFQQLAGLYLAVNDFENARKSAARAADLFRERLERQPDDPALLTSLGSCLRVADKMPEAESVLRKAVQLAPKDWTCRVALARLLDAEARHDVNDRATFLTGRPSSVGVALAQRRLSEAGDNLDLAVTNAPEEAEVWFRRGLHRCLRANLLRQIRVAAGESPDELDLADNSFSPEALADLQHAARLSPRSYARIGNAVLFEIYTVSARKGRVNWTDFSWNSLPDKSQRSLHDALNRLENLGQDSDPLVASGALEVLGLLQGSVFHETRSCVATLRRAVALDASREQAVEVLVSTLAQSGRYDELLAVCADRVKQKDNARSHLFLAKAYEKLKQWDDAEAEILEALREAPGDFIATLDYAAALLRRSEDPAILVEANNWLVRAEGLLGQMPPAQRNQQTVIDLTLDRSIYFALNDDVDAARQWAKAVLKTDSTNKLAREILSAMDY